DVGLGEGDATGVLHRPEVVFGDEHLVVFAERVRVVEVFGEEVHSLPGDLDDGVGVEMIGEGAAAQHPQRHPQVVAGPRRIDPMVGAGDDGGDVGGDRLGGGEGHRLDVVALD